MVELPDGTILVAEGEVMPARCDCGRLFQPRPEDDGERIVLCPSCDALVDLDDTVWAPVEATKE